MGVIFHCDRCGKVTEPGELRALYIMQPAGPKFLWMEKLVQEDDDIFCRECIDEIRIVASRKKKLNATEILSLPRPKLREEG